MKLAFYINSSISTPAWLHGLVGKMTHVSMALTAKRVAYLVEKKYPAEKLVDVMKQAKEARENGQQVLVVRMNKNKKFQKEQLAKEGYEEFVEFFNK